LQALDQAAADPRTRALLPGNVTDSMRFVNNLLQPNERPMLNQSGLSSGASAPAGDRVNGKP
jgi:hypothetical protein